MVLNSAVSTHCEVSHCGIKFSREDIVKVGVRRLEGDVRLLCSLADHLHAPFAVLGVQNPVDVGG